MLDQLRAAVKHTLQLLGCPSVHDLDPSWIANPPPVPLSPRTVTLGDGQLA